MKMQAKARRTLIRSVAAFFAALLGAILITTQCMTPAASASEPLTKSGACATGGNTIAECFPDPVLATAVASAASDSGHQFTTSSKFTSTVASRVKQISMTDQNLASLEGLGLLTSLRILYIPSSQLTDISSVANLTNLTDLTINSSPNIESFTPVSGLTNLVNLSLSGDGINSDEKPLPSLSRLSSLIYLTLDNNSISDLTPLRGLTQLMRLSLADNSVADISVLHNLPNLTYLYLQNDENLPPYEDGNQVSDLEPLQGLPLVQFTITNQHPTDLATSSTVVSVRVPKSVDGSFVAPAAGTIQPSSGSYNPVTGTVTWDNLEYVHEVSFGFDIECDAKGCKKFSGTVSRTLPFEAEAFSLDPSPNTQAQDPIPAPNQQGQPERPKPSTPQKPGPKNPTPDPAPQPFGNPNTPGDKKHHTLVKPNQILVASQATQPHDSMATTGAAITVVVVVAVVALAFGIYLIVMKKKHSK
ncbi:hypothetical protein OZX62_09315 [Bifidobacterium sp. ESL0690]|uniref:leucine-rich repeat domain-containing protein n=1 Tax=Bifidobacterium sp. ESL0690 TaxID=2983214 RepID=UPI0023F7608A|nr:leucine-rich repeat domain-containing protein [Bifidobacterium sp. ESL0690]WEV46611.1 hypothetical protein OZX62_09315 [Bifidobacterium sp. ESL0690]